MALALRRNSPWVGRWISATFQQSRVLLLPTDTVYGFSCTLSDTKAMQRIARIKSRKDTKFIYLVSSFSQADSVADISRENKKILEEYWPGPITFILPSKSPSDEGTKTIALRLPADPDLRQWIASAREPLLSTSCNRSGEPVLESFHKAKEQFGTEVDLLVDGGEISSKPSTVVDLTGDSPRVLREGVTPFQISN